MKTEISSAPAWICLSSSMPVHVNLKHFFSFNYVLAYAVLACLVDSTAVVTN